MSADVQARRFELLHTLYRKAQGSPLASVDVEKAGTEVGLPRDEITSGQYYLLQKGLVTGAGGRRVRLTHEGVDAVERALAEPEQPSSYFPLVIAKNVIQAHSIEGSTIQQGTSGSMQSVVISNSDRERVRGLLAELLSELGAVDLAPTVRGEVEVDVQTMDAQLGGPNPKPTNHP